MIRQPSVLRLPSAWFAWLYIAMFLFLFLHECGHGFGSRIDGSRVSTGFNRVGDPGKRPGDPDFRANQAVSGTLNAGGVLGPLVNWLGAIVFTGLLFTRRRLDAVTLGLGAGGVANAAMRFVPMSVFFLGALSGRLGLEDEVSWGLASVRSLEWPMPLADFRVLAESQPGLFLSEPGIYVWPAISLGVSAACLILAYGRLTRLLRLDQRPRLLSGLFIFMPLAVWPFLFFAADRLDRLIRIDW